VKVPGPAFNGAFRTLHHKRTGEGALATSIALDSVYSRQIGVPLRANQVHNGMAFRQGGTGRSAARLARCSQNKSFHV